MATAGGGAGARLTGQGLMQGVRSITNAWAGLMEQSAGQRAPLAGAWAYPNTQLKTAMHWRASGQ